MTTTISAQDYFNTTVTEAAELLATDHTLAYHTAMELLEHPGLERLAHDASFWQGLHLHCCEIREPAQFVSFMERFSPRR